MDDIDFFNLVLFVPTAVDVDFNIVFGTQPVYGFIVLSDDGLGINGLQVIDVRLHNKRQVTLQYDSVTKGAANSCSTPATRLQLEIRSKTMPDKQSLHTSKSGMMTACVSLLLAALCPPVAAEPALLLTGYSTGSAAPATSGNVDLAAALLQLGISDDTALFAQSAHAQAAEAKNNYAAAVSSLSGAQPFARLYLPCMMILASNTGGSSIRIPANSGSIFLERWDQTSGEAFSAVLAAATAGPEETGVAASAAPAWLQPNGQAATLLGYQTIVYSGIPGDQGMVNPAQAGGSAVAPVRPEPDGYNIAVTVDFRLSYSAWIAAEVSGSEITRQFLLNLHHQLPAGQPMHPLFQGELQRQAELLELGVALQTIESEESQIGGSTVGKTTRESQVSGIHLFEADPGLCSHSFIPADFQQAAAAN